MIPRLSPRISDDREAVQRPLVILFGRAKDGRGEVGVMDRVWEALSLQAKPSILVISHATFANDRAVEEVGRVNLQPW